jgi:hypothetical protein
MVESFPKPYKLAKDLYDKFVAEFGSCVCRDVQNRIFGRSFNLWDAQEFKEFEEMGAHRDKCPDVVGKVAKWAAEILLVNGLTVPRKDTTRRPS